MLFRSGYFYGFVVAESHRRRPVDNPLELGLVGSIRGQVHKGILNNDKLHPGFAGAPRAADR